MSLIWRYLRRYRWYCLTALLFVLMEANCELLLPTLMARMIDEGVRSGQIDRILELGGWMAGAAIGGAGRTDGELNHPAGLIPKTLYGENVMSFQLSG